MPKNCVRSFGPTDLIRGPQSVPVTVFETCPQIPEGSLTNTERQAGERKAPAARRGGDLSRTRQGGRLDQ